MPRTNSSSARVSARGAQDAKPRTLVRRRSAPRMSNAIVIGRFPEIRRRRPALTRSGAQFSLGGAQALDSVVDGLDHLTKHIFETRSHGIEPVRLTQHAIDSVLDVPRLSVGRAFEIAN